MWLVKFHLWWEVCAGRAGIGYLLGYPFKSDTSVVAKLNDAHAAQAAGGHKAFDEVRFLQHYRSVAATEGAVRLLGLKLVRQYSAASEIRARTSPSLSNFHSAANLPHIAHTALWSLRQRRCSCAGRLRRVDLLMHGLSHLCCFCSCCTAPSSTAHNVALCVSRCSQIVTSSVRPHRFDLVVCVTLGTSVSS